MRSLRFLSLLLLLGSTAIAQIKTDIINAKNIAINWQIITNSHAGGSQFLSALNLKNNDVAPLNNTGWKLYFNFARRIQQETVTGNVSVTHVNGDLYYISPTSKFTPVNNGTSVDIEFVSSDWALNSTDAPEGFYFIYDDQPNRPIPIKDVKAIPSTRAAQFARNPQDHVLPTSPEMIYAQNQNIENLPLKDLQRIFPSPTEYKATQGELIINQYVTLKSDPLFAAERSFLEQKLNQYFAVKKGSAIVQNGNLKSARQNSNNIQLKLNSSLGEEAYHLEISSSGVLISASGKAGIFYGIQSLLSAFPPQKGAIKITEISLQNAVVSDSPRFPFRGLMIDVARNFQTKTQILKVLDLMAMYKLNVLHFHISDDEGWRLEIPGLPQLTNVGSRRGHFDGKPLDHLIPSFGSGPFLDNQFGSGHYSKQDFIEILKYARSRHIQVIPEIEAPGHARAAIRSMEARYHELIKAGNEKEANRYLLQDINDKSVYRSVQSWNDNVIDPSLPSAYNFVEKVSDEIIAMYKAADAPLKTIHFGGDEVPEGAWEGSPSSLKFIQENPSLKNINGLWTHFYGRINDILKRKNLYLSGWEEVGMKPVTTDGKRAYVINPELADQNIHLNVWNNVIGWGAEDLAYKLANTGYKVVLSGVSNLYFDMAYQKSFEEPGYYWGEFVDIDKAFNFIPFNAFLNSNKDKLGNTLKPGFYDSKERLTAKGKANIVGIQGLLWSETIKGGKGLEYMLMPKLLGLAERAWAADPEWANETDSVKRTAMYNLAWSQFVNVIGKKELPRIDATFNELNYRLPPAGAVVKNGQVYLNIQFPGLTVRYTTDGTEPNEKSRIYTEPISTKGQVNFRTFDSKGRGGRISSIRNTDIATAAPKELL